MRDILFRAKAINRDSIDGRCRRTDYKNGDWVYGLITKPYNEEYDFPAEMRNTDGVTGIEVDYKTIGQFTGLTDKNGTKVFEGDIVKFKHGGEFDKEIYYRNYAVEFINTYVTYGLRLRNRSIHFPFKKATASQHDAEVIGNIYDNPELIGDVDK
jgi:uncharacterized phage protein (TIGR01671 family)